MRYWSRAAAWMGKIFLRKQFNIGLNNLKRVYGGNLSPLQLERLGEKSLENFILSCLESIIKPVDKYIVFEGNGVSSLIQRPADQGLIVASLHLGCWDLALRELSHRLQNIAVVYRSMPNAEADQVLNRARSANSHCHWINKNDTRKMLDWLRKGKTLVVMTDLHGRRNTLEVDILGLASRVSSGPFRLSQKTGCPIVPAAHVREDNGLFRVHVGEPIKAPPGPEGPRLQAQSLCHWQEPWIHHYCEQYLWMYRHWRKQEGTRLRPEILPAERIMRQLPP